MYSHVSLSHSVIPKDVYVVRLNSKVLKDGQGGWIISDFPVRSTLKFIYNCVYINCQYYYLVIKNLSILALKLEHFSFIIIQNYSSEGIWSKFSSFEEWPHPLHQAFSLYPSVKLKYSINFIYRIFKVRISLFYTWIMIQTIKQIAKVVHQW